MSLTEFDEEEFKRVCREDGYEDGLADGATQKALEDAENLLKEGIDQETVARCIGLPLEQVIQIKENLSVRA
ncbi:MAG: hypothetical protein IKQ43_00365 [Treponema sp.]|nr:hypothetical protein [Treponema sp.]